jgi:transcriptional regulator with XRE-family HTH domain
MTRETFRLIRLYSGKSQREFADFIGVSNATIGYIETGRRPITPNIKAKLAAKFDLTDHFFVYIEKYRKLPQ